MAHLAIGFLAGVSFSITWYFADCYFTMRRNREDYDRWQAAMRRMNQDRRQ